jgi:hypothetical protein
MTKVYLVTEIWDYEGSSTRAVCDSLEVAKLFIDSRYIKGNEGLHYAAMPDFRVCDSIEIEECDLLTGVDVGNINESPQKLVLWTT